MQSLSTGIGAKDRAPVADDGGKARAFEQFVKNASGPLYRGIDAEVCLGEDRTVNPGQGSGAEGKKFIREGIGPGGPISLRTTENFFELRQRRHQRRVESK